MFVSITTSFGRPAIESRSLMRMLRGLWRSRRGRRAETLRLKYSHSAAYRTTFILRSRSRRNWRSRRSSAASRERPPTPSTRRSPIVPSPLHGRRNMAHFHSVIAPSTTSSPTSMINLVGTPTGNSCADSSAGSNQIDDVAAKSSSRLQPGYWLSL